MSDKAFIYGLIGGTIAGYLAKPRQQQIQQPIQQQLVRMPHEFNYVIDIYTNKIEIADQNGSKTTLYDIDDLSDWLSSTTDKDILIWNHGDMTGTIKLTSNRYVIYGKPTKFKTLLTQPNIDLYYLTPSQFFDQRVFSGRWYPNFAITNFDIENWNWIPISNVNIFTIGASLIIYGDFFHTEQALENIHVTAIDSPYIYINGIKGGVISSAYITLIEGSELTDGLIAISNTLSLYKVKINNYLFIESSNASIYETDYSQVSEPFIDIQGEIGFVNVMPNQTVSDELPVQIGRSSEQVWEITGIYEVIYGSGYSYYLPLSRSEVDVQLNLDNNTLSITNKTSRTMSIVISFRSHSLF
jgi:hypothetical protein